VNNLQLCIRCYLPLHRSFSASCIFHQSAFASFSRIFVLFLHSSMVAIFAIWLGFYRLRSRLINVRTISSSSHLVFICYQTNVSVIPIANYVSFLFRSLFLSPHVPCFILSFPIGLYFVSAHLVLVHLVLFHLVLVQCRPHSWSLDSNFCAICLLTFRNARALFQTFHYSPLVRGLHRVAFGPERFSPMLTFVVGVLPSSDSLSLSPLFVFASVPVNSQSCFLVDQAFELPVAFVSLVRSSMNS
jgi:hypothetical protein